MASNWCQPAGGGTSGEWHGADDIMLSWYDSRICMTLCLAIGLGLGCALPAIGQSGEELVEAVIDLLSDKDKDVRALGLEQVRSEAKGEAATRRLRRAVIEIAAGGAGGPAQCPGRSRRQGGASRGGRNPEVEPRGSGSRGGHQRTGLPGRGGGPSAAFGATCRGVKSRASRRAQEPGSFAAGRRSGSNRRGDEAVAAAAARGPARNPGGPPRWRPRPTSCPRRSTPIRTCVPPRWPRWANLRGRSTFPAWCRACSSRSGAKSVMPPKRPSYWFAAGSPTPPNAPIHC